MLGSAFVPGRETIAKALRFASKIRDSLSALEGDEREDPAWSDDEATSEATSDDASSADEQHEPASDAGEEEEEEEEEPAGDENRPIGGNAEPAAAEPAAARYEKPGRPRLDEIARRLEEELEALARRDAPPPSTRRLDGAADVALWACMEALGAPTKGEALDRVAALAASGDAAATRILAQLLDVERLPQRSQRRNRILDDPPVARAIVDPIGEEPSPRPYGALSERERIAHAFFSPTRLRERGAGALARAFGGTDTPRRLARRAMEAPTPGRLETLDGAIRNLGEEGRRTVAEELGADPEGARRLGAAPDVPAALADLLDEVLAAPEPDAEVDTLAGSLAGLWLVGGGAPRPRA